MPRVSEMTIERDRPSPRRGLAALLADELGLYPQTTSFKINKASEYLLDQWMNENLRIALQLRDNPSVYERELIRRREPPLNCEKKVCPLNAQQLLVLGRHHLGLEIAK